MSDETKKPEQEVNPESSEETTTSKEVESNDGESIQQDSEYEDKLKALDERASKAEEERDNLKVALTQSRDKLKAKAATIEETAEQEKQSEIEVDKIHDIVDRVTTEKVNAIRTDLAVATFENVLNSLTDNVKERELIKQHYKQSIRPSGIDERSIRNDLVLAKAAANIEYLEFKNQPKFDSKMTTAMNMSGGKDSGLHVEKEANLSDEDTSLLKSFGVDPKEAAKKLARE